MFSWREPRFPAVLGFFAAEAEAEGFGAVVAAAEALERPALLGGMTILVNITVERKD